MAEALIPKVAPKITALDSIQAAPRVDVRPAVEPPVRRFVTPDRTGDFRSLPFSALLDGRRIGTSHAVPFSTMFRLPLIARQRRVLTTSAAPKFFVPPLPVLVTKPQTPVVETPATPPEINKPLLTRLTGRRQDGAITTTHGRPSRPARVPVAATYARPSAVVTPRPSFFGARPVLPSPASPATITASQLPVTVHTEETPLQAARETASPREALAQVKSSFELKVRAFAANLYDDGIIPMQHMPKLAKALSQSFGELFKALDEVLSQAPETLTAKDTQNAMAALNALGLYGELTKSMSGFEALPEASKTSALINFVIGLLIKPNFAVLLKDRLEMLMMRQAQTMLAQAQTRPMGRVASPLQVTADLRGRALRRGEVKASETDPDEDRETTLVSKPASPGGTDANGGGQDQHQQHQE